MNLYIKTGITSIGKRAFYNCSSLESINIPEGKTNSLEEIKTNAENGIISGNANSDETRTIAPLNNAMRCEAAVMLMRFYENILLLN